MYRQILIDGVDRIGKTSLATLIQNSDENVVFKVQKLNAPLVIKGGEKIMLERDKIQVQDIFQTLEVNQFSKPENNIQKGIIFDRTHLSEMVYGKLYRNKTNFEDFEYIKEIERKYSFNDLTLILLTTDDVNIVLDREDGQSYSSQKLKKLQEIQEFETVFKNSAIKRKFMFNINKISLQDIIKVLKNEN